MGTPCCSKFHLPELGQALTGDVGKASVWRRAEEEHVSHARALFSAAALSGCVPQTQQCWEAGPSGRAWVAGPTLMSGLEKGWRQSLTCLSPTPPSALLCFARGRCSKRTLARHRALDLGCPRLQNREKWLSIHSELPSVWCSATAHSTAQDPALQRTVHQSRTCPGPQLQPAPTILFQQAEETGGAQ